MNRSVLGNLSTWLSHFLALLGPGDKSGLGLLRLYPRGNQPLGTARMRRTPDGSESSLADANGPGSEDALK